MIVWIIGISGAGKSTLAETAAELLRARGRHCIVLDGDELREVWGDNLGHSLEQRRVNHERISRLCALLDRQLGPDSTTHVLVPALSIFPDLRAWHRETFSNYLEVFIDISVNEAAKRDVKGIYAAAAAGNRSGVAGLDLPFPKPERPDLIFEGADLRHTPADLALQLLQRIEGSATA